MSKILLLLFIFSIISFSQSIKLKQEEFTIEDYKNVMKAQIMEKAAKDD